MINVVEEDWAHENQEIDHALRKVSLGTSHEL